MRGTGGVGNGGMGSDPLGGQPANQVAQQLRLATMQMRTAGHVQPDAVGRIGRTQRGIAQAPGGQAAQRRGIRLRFGRMHPRLQPGHQRLRLGEWHAGAQAQRRRRRVHRRHHHAAPIMRRGDQRPVSPCLRCLRLR
jgi:hypothetical protein